MNILEQACHDILYKNMNATNEAIFLLYDTESPLAIQVSDAYKKIIPAHATTKEFVAPPQPLYRGGMVNPDNPHTEAQNRVATTHNISENEKIGIDHHKNPEVKSVEGSDLSHQEAENPEVEAIKNSLISLPKWSIVILVQSTNFRLSTFRIRLELFNRGIHVIEHNHLAYIPEEQFETFYKTLEYRTPEYVRLQNEFAKRFAAADETRIESFNGDILRFGKIEPIRGNTGDYSEVENKGGSLPIGEIFTEAIDLDDVSGTCWFDTIPNIDFSIAITKPFPVKIEKWRVVETKDLWPEEFIRLYDLVTKFENGEMRVRELGFGLNPGPSTETPLRDINYHERKVGVHLSLGKKHGIYGKKLPKTELQRFHIDVFISLGKVFIGDEKVFDDGKWLV